jgi:hypothetical protein
MPQQKGVFWLSMKQQPGNVLLGRPPGRLGADDCLNASYT